MNAQRSMERSVESLKQVYAVVVAIAISVAVERLLIDPATDTIAALSAILPRLPAFLAIVVVVVPFFHGMNRHLDHCYVDRNDGHAKGAPLLWDIVIFFFQSCILFMAATAIATGIQTFWFIGGLLVLDIVWAIPAHFAHYQGVKPGVAQWAAVNTFSLVLAALAGLTEFYPSTWKPVVLAIVVGIRTFLDYRTGWRFYFPSDDVATAR